MKDEDDDTPDPSDAWTERFLAGALPYAGLLQKEAAKTGYPTWRVEETEPGRFAVLRNGAPDDTRPDAVMKNRKTAYLTAAVLTAMGGFKPQEGASAVPLPAGLLAEGDPKRAHLLTQLMAKPEAVLLLVEATEPDVLRQAFDIANERLRQKTGEN